ncbi:MAG: hypothetical protein WCL44_09250 [bacterium]
MKQSTVVHGLSVLGIVVFVAVSVHSQDGDPAAVAEADLDRALSATNASSETPAAASAEPPVDAPPTVDAPAETAPSMPSESPVESNPPESPAALPAEVPAEAPSAEPTVAPTETPADVPAAEPTEAPAVAPAEAAPETPAEAPAAEPTEAPAVAPAEAAPETPAEAPAAEPTEAPAVAPAEAAPATPVEAPTAAEPTEAPVVAPVEAAPETPVEAPTAAEPTEAPAAAPETPAEAPAAEPTEAPAVAPTETPAETPVEEMPTEVPAEAAAPAAGAGEGAPVEGAGEGVEAGGPDMTALDADNQQKITEEIKQIQAARDVELGQKAIAYEAYETGLSHFQSAERILPDTPLAAQLRIKANEGAMICQYNIALAKLEAGELEGEKGALNYAKQALGRNRKFKAAQRLIERIEFRIKEEALRDKRRSVRRTTSPDYLRKKNTMEQWIEMAVQHIRVEEFDEAQARLKMVLAIDPANQSAMDLLREIQATQLKVNARERDVTSKEAMKDVTRAWLPRDYYNYVEPIRAPSVITTNAVIDPGAPLRSKMESITIQEINFVEANIHNVVEILRKLAQEGDRAEKDPMKKGVNFILKLGDSSPKAITFGAKYVSLLETVKIITDVADLSYRIEGQVVMIVPKDEAGGPIVTRFYAVDPSVVRALATGSPSAPVDAGGEGGEDPFTPAGEEGAAAVSDVPSDLMSPLKTMGVKFPRGSSITYSAGISKIIHANTVDNLAMFEKVLAEFNTINPQVEIETRFVDISQSDLEELGFEWRLMDNVELLQKAGSGGLPAAARPRVTMNANNSSGGFSKGLRFDSVTDGGMFGRGEVGSLLAIQSMLTSADMMWLLHAVEQSGHADLLSAPKVTTQPGEEATVKVTTEYIYPTEYALEGGNVNGIGTAAYLQQQSVMVPQGFETREVGVILTVKPELSPDRSTISLMLSPDVVTEPTWHDYGYKLADGTDVPMKMPFFHRRSASTTVRVYDGSTVVMGGMIAEDLRTADDKIPLLGSIPIIGRLFQSKQNRSEKRNLLIFVTARLVDPAGRAFKPKKNTIPEDM